MPVSSTFVGVLRAGAGSTSAPYRAPGGVRRSLPNMAHSHLVHEPAKIYPYHLLLITNYRLPHDVDRLNLEVSFFCCFFLLSGVYLVLIVCSGFFRDIFPIWNLKLFFSVVDMTFIAYLNGGVMILKEEPVSFK